MGTVYVNLLLRTCLAPKYIKALPRDPRHNERPDQQYFYQSNGKDFKIISHGNPDCELLRKRRPDMVDPMRDCNAVGLWTAGAKNW